MFHLSGGWAERNMTTRRVSPLEANSAISAISPSDELGGQLKSANRTPGAGVRVPPSGESRNPFAAGDFQIGGSQGEAAERSACQVTREHLGLRLGSYVYDLTTAAGASVFFVSDGRRSVSANLGWAFAEGEVGETYVFMSGGIFYEGRLRYFPALQALDITPGQQRSIPSDLDTALGRPLNAEETRFCFGCHNTACSAGGHSDPDHLIPGVTCEACHGPGAKHVAAIRAGQRAEGLCRTMNPAKLDPADSVDYCGACHRTWADVMESGMEGVATVRFQPYRLELSRCWGRGDARLTCLACHDPHQPLIRDPGSYDRTCLRCHVTTEGSKASSDHHPAACPRSTKDCVTCLMAKYEVPGTHTKFTDHRIRVVQSDRDCPD
jgi:hypothetical protein